jgi:hypothetical protein
MLHFAALIALTAPAATHEACLDISDGRERSVILTGRLERHVYPGLPNYESIQRGDEPETAYILVLDRAICTRDAGERFNRVHLFTSQDRLLPPLRAAVGHRIRVRGTGFASFTMHNRAPLVVNVRSINSLGH